MWDGLELQDAQQTERPEVVGGRRKENDHLQLNRAWASGNESLPV